MVINTAPRNILADLKIKKIDNKVVVCDIVYNPKETNFLKTGNNLGSKTENGKKMFIFQAAEAFKIWHDILPEINNKLLE